MDILIKSLLAGVVTALILIVAKHAGPKLAGALGGIPIVFAVSYIFVTMSDKSTAKGFLIGGVIGAVAAIIFSLALMGLNQQFPKWHWLNFALAYVLCFFVALGGVQLVGD